MKKLLKTGLTTAVIAGTLFSGFPGNYVKTSAEVLHPSLSSVSQSHSYGSLDLSVVNEDKLLDSLIKQGIISKTASSAEQQKALHSYLELKGKEDKVTTSDPLAAKVKAAEAEKQRKFKDYNNGLLKGNGNKYGQLKGNPDPVKEDTAPNQPLKKGKLLTLMVEYSDFAHNNIKPEETDNFYPDYTPEHYENMIFGEKGEYKGPNGENQVSQKQYYEEQSGGSYSIEGKAYGWLKVPGTAAYYGSDKASGGHDNVTPGGSKQLVIDTYKAALAAGIPLEDYDLEDPHDLDSDGNFWEPDGLVDHLQIIHSGMGQEAGGGSLGNNAIWSHRSAKYVPGTSKPGFYDYTMMPEDGATGVFAHEYGHDLGLPDEYDTIYSGKDEPIGYWSIMSAGSWAGTIPGAEPTGFSPWAKQYFQSTLGGNWTNPTAINFEDVSTKGAQYLLDQANSPLGQNNQAIRVNLPKKKTPINTPAAGSYEYWGGQADEIDNKMVVDVDLRGKTSAELTFDAWYDTEEQWDFGFVQVSTDNGATWKSIGNENTRSDVVSDAYPTILDSMPGFTGKSNGWEAEKFDLSSFAGKNIKLRLRYATDWGTSNIGFFADNIKVVADGQTLVNDGAEDTTSKFTLNGFTKMDGNKLTNHYYLLEWRNHKGVDQGLAHLKRGDSIMSYDGGLVVWYVDDSYTENWTGIHPGNGFLGVVDAHDDTNLLWNYANGATPVEANTRYHLTDAAFGLNPTSAINLNYPGVQTLTAPSQDAVSLFDDSKDYNNTFLPDAGRDIKHYGLKVRVNGQAKDKSVGSIVIYK
ncbi:immune inhibitor A domain-containing protein [Neobacillus pocheonensis]|uniref:immune inhibitor A domain-containing protein n=1 Tax=Neobacillus pocheonensis TaxID=363869 RepID=UPI003D275CBA